MKMIFLAMGLINLVGMAVVLLGKENTNIQKEQDNKDLAVNNFAVDLKRAS
ncbi:hypothetical protein [Clostridium novyi]|uniref:hypothetical protein n=1 Tax=Clostridium novyi TaxID=1542 RepID=UPI000A8B131C|nr:hypothetical protein [Clostridium novyi]